MTRLGLFANALAIGGMIAVTQPAHAQSAPAPSVQPGPPAAPPNSEQAPDAKAPNAEMMAMQQKMMADMKAADATLDALVVRMNSAEGVAKVDAIAELLKTMVQQQRTMHDGMMQMQGQMMMRMHSQMTMPMGAAPKPANR